MERKEYNGLIEEIEEFPMEREQIQQILDIEDTLRTLGFFWHPRKFLESFRNELQIWKRASERIDIPREERSSVVLGAILGIAYERLKKKQ